MDRDVDRQKTFTRRTAMLAAGKLSLLGLLMGRMYYLQVVESNQYQILAEENRINLRLLAPPRGRILDRFGVEVARNQQNFRVSLTPEATESVAETLRRLADLLEITEAQVARVLRDVERQRRFMPVTVAENLTWHEFARVNVHLPDLPGVQTDVGRTRQYPFRDRLAHVVGYVAAVAERELTGDPLLELPDFRIGKNGIERAHDLLLRGSAGDSRVEVNAYGRVIRELKRREGQPGQDVALSIDTGLQDFVYRRLAEESASAVVLDVHTGEILAMVSSPSYDPGAFNRGLSVKSWRALRDHPRKPLINKAASGQYPPGSVFKSVVALAALEAGVAGTGHRVFCNGRMRLGNHTFHCWRFKYGGHGWMNMHQAIEQSCDIYFYDIAKRLGVDRIADMARRFGLGEAPGVELAGIRSGLVPTKAWKLALTGKPWQQGETLITGIGQGYLLTTPLQLAVMTARLVNGGLAVEPRLVRALSERPDGEAVAAPSLGISPAALRVVLGGMDAVVNGKRGTARSARLKGEVQMGGKTGTAQVRRITKAERQKGGKLAADTPWEERDHSLFVGYAPVASPRYATAVVIEHGGSGTNAAKVTKDIVTELLKRDPARRAAIGRLAGPGPAAGQGRGS
ncbi:MAG: penicillin-binding protein 2 [Alphaproteobacteria bacterium]|jgi:penicillin-binding protein 2|nr:penicillin-binding protein 2 [Alphaproteobacteria bacterium]